MKKYIKSGIPFLSDFFPRIVNRIKFLHGFMGRWRINFDRLLISKTSKQLFWLAVLFVAVFFFLLYGLGLDHNFLFKGMTSYDYESVKSDSVGYFGLKLLYLVGVCFFSGFLVMILTNGVRNKIEKIISGDVRYRFENHALIFGYNDISDGVMANLLFNKKYEGDIVLVVENRVREIREKIEGRYGKRQNVFILHGNRNSLSELESFYPECARAVYIIGENEPNSDFKNLDCYRSLKDIESFPTWKAYINLFLQEQSSLTLMNNRRYDNDNFKDIEDDYRRLRILNTDERWARRILVDADNEWPDMNLNMRLDKRITMDSDYYVHLVIFGMTDMGEVIATTAAKTCHHPNYITKGIRTRITVVDSDFSQNRGVFHGRYYDFMEMCHYSIKRIEDNTLVTVEEHHPKKELDFLDIEWEFIESVPDSVLLQKELMRYANSADSILSVVVCGVDEAQNVSIALGLPKIYFDNSIPIWLYTRSYSSIKYYFQDTRYDNIISWGMPGIDSLQESWEESAARIYMSPAEGVSWDDESVFQSWAWLPLYRKNSIITQVAAIPSIVGSMKNWSAAASRIEFDNDEELEVFMKLEHTRWAVCALLNGYRPLDHGGQTMGTFSYDRESLRKQFINECIMKYEYLPQEMWKYDKDALMMYLDIINDKRLTPKSFQRNGNG